MSVRELAVLLSVVVFGLAAGREMLRSHRWEPSHFRRGITVFKGALPLPQPLGEVPLPPRESHFIWAAQVDSKRISPHEVAFLAPQLTWAAMRGWLRYDSDRKELQVRGYLNWASLALVLCASLLRWQFTVGVAALCILAYAAERARFARILMTTTRVMGGGV